jgi:hypothetical protein
LQRSKNSEVVRVKRMRLLKRMEKLKHGPIKGKEYGKRGLP